MTSSHRAVILFALLALPVASGCFAQVTNPTVFGPLPAEPQNVSAPPATDVKSLEQTLQRIHTEDANARIDEIRVGGETQSITVQPKTNSKLPAYEVKPADSTRTNAPSSTSDTNGARVWNVLKF